MVEKRTNTKSGKRVRSDTAAISDGLKSLYRSVVEEPIPDDLLSLLNSLDDSPDAGSDG